MNRIPLLSASVLGILLLAAPAPAQRVETRPSRSDRREEVDPAVKRDLLLRKLENEGKPLTPTVDETSVEAKSRADLPAPKVPLYRSHPPHQVVVGEVGDAYILTRAELNAIVDRMPPSAVDLPVINLSGEDPYAKERQQRQMEGKALEEWAVLKTIALLAQQNGIQVSRQELDAAIEKLTGNGSNPLSGGAGESNRKAVAIDPETMRQSVMDSIRIEKFLTQQIEKNLTDEGLEKIYNANQARYVQPRRYRVWQIFRKIDPNMGDEEIQDLRKEFYKVRKRAARHDGRDFAEVAREESDLLVAKESGGDIGWVDMNFPLEDRLWKEVEQMKVGEVSQIIPTMAGFHILMVSDIEEPKGTIFDDFARKRVIDDLIFQQKERLGPGLIRAVPFKVRLNASGLRLIQPGDEVRH